jgi:hypothetical protein
MLRASSPISSPSSVDKDVTVHDMPDFMAEEQLDTFRRAFLPMFPFVHVPATLKASSLRRERPFLWLNIMALTTKMVSQQFAMEDTIWRIISQRVMVQHLADMDLLLGVVCFASWSHYFKKDKPFMTMITQVAVSLACELGLQGEVSFNCSVLLSSRSIDSVSANVGPFKVPVRSNKRSKSATQGEQQPRKRTIEERRTILAVFHLTSA